MTSLLYRSLAIGLFLLDGIPMALADDLPRRIALGTQVQPVTSETQQRLGLRNTRGVEVKSVLPDSTAAEAGILPGDVLLSFDGPTFLSVPEFVEAVGNLRSEKELTIRLNREGKEQSIKTVPKPLPFETSDAFDIEYGSVSTPVGKLRLVLTLPKSKEKLPAFVLLSGLGNGPSEHPHVDPLGMRQAAYNLTQKGFAVLRVDKPGCGDSEGGPAKDVEFGSVVDGYVAAVRKLKQHPRIQSDRIILSGFSIGGVQAPLVAQEESVFAISLFGSMNIKWKDFILSSTDRQSRMSGVAATDLKPLLAMEEKGWDLLLKEGLAPDNIALRDAELVGWVDRTWQDGKYFSGITYRYFQQLDKRDIAAAWKQFDGPVLAMWGEFDFVTSKESHEQVAQVVNAAKPGKALFQLVPGTDHQMLSVQSVEESLKRMGKPSTQVTDAIADWVKKQL